MRFPIIISECERRYGKFRYYGDRAGALVGPPDKETAPAGEAEAVGIFSMLCRLGMNRHG
jgi:hypothetical protein